MGINHQLDDNECYVGDGGYYNGRQWAETPTGYNNHEQKMYAMARACHEMELTDDSNSLGAYQIPIGTHCIGMGQCFML